MAKVLKNDTTLTSKINELQGEKNLLLDERRLIRNSYDKAVRFEKKRLRVSFKKEFKQDFFRKAVLLLAVGFGVIAFVFRGPLLFFLFLVFAWFAYTLNNENMAWERYYKKNSSVEFPFKRIGELNSRIKDIENEIESWKRGQTGESIVANVLEQLPDDYIIFHDLRVPIFSGGGTTQIDHVVVGPCGVICIETKHLCGNFFPNGRTWLWQPVNGYTNKRIVIKNPQNQSIYHVKVLNKFFERKKLQVDVQPVVVLTHPRTKWKGLWKDEHCPVLYSQHLFGYIKRYSGRCPDEALQELKKLIL